MIESHAKMLSIEMKEVAEEAAKILRSLSNPHRLILLCTLIDGEKSVTELCQTTGSRQSLVSQHLHRLRLEKIVRSERRGQHIYYALSNPVVEELVSILFKNSFPTKFENKNSFPNDSPA